jgi:hypothetical protein
MPEVLEAADISRSLETIVCDATTAGVDVRFRFYGILSQVLHAEKILGTRKELIALQRSLAIDARGMKAGRKGDVMRAIRKLDELINAQPEMMGSATLADKDGRERKVRLIDPNSLVRMRRR